MCGLIILCVVFFMISHETLAEFYQPKCTANGLTCLDCYSQKMCIGAFGYYMNTGNSSCQDDVTSKNNIYCNPTTNKCQSTPPDECNPIKEFKCPWDGSFPDFHTCNKFISCENNNITFETCPKNHIFSIKFGKCVLRLKQTDCAPTANCTSQMRSLQDPNLFFECNRNIPQLKICPKITEFYNDTTKQCNSTCSHIGLMPNYKNCSRYYSCEKNHTGNVLVAKTCAKGHGFNQFTRKCEKGYDKFCNELVGIDTHYANIPVLIRIALAPIRTLQGLFNLDPINLMKRFGMNETLISDGLLSVDYYLETGTAPPVLVTTLEDILLNYVPAPVRPIIQMMLPSLLSNLLKKRSSRTLDNELEIFEATAIASMALNDFLNVEVVQVKRESLQLNRESIEAFLKGFLENFLLRIFGNGIDEDLLSTLVEKLPIFSVMDMPILVPTTRNLPLRQSHRDRGNYESVTYFFHGIISSFRGNFNSAIDGVIALMKLFTNETAQMPPFVVSLVGSYFEEAIAFLQKLKSVE